VPAHSRPRGHRGSDTAGSVLRSQRGVHVNANGVKTSLMPTVFPSVHLEDRSGLFNAGLDGQKCRAIDMGRGFVIDELALEELLPETPGYNSNHPPPKSNASLAV